MACLSTWSEWMKMTSPTKQTMLIEASSQSLLLEYLRGVHGKYITWVSPLWQQKNGQQGTVSLIEGTTFHNFPIISWWEVKFYFPFHFPGPARCLIVRPYAHSSELSYSNVVINISSLKKHLFNFNFLKKKKKERKKTFFSLRSLFWAKYLFKFLFWVNLLL